MPEIGSISEAYIRPRSYTKSSGVLKHAEPVSTEKIKPVKARERKRGGSVERVDARAKDHGEEEVVEKKPMKPMTYHGEGSRVAKMADGNVSTKNPYAIRLTPHERKRGGMVDGSAPRHHGNRPGTKGH